MARGLRDVDRLAADFHRGQWCLTHLARDFSIDVVAWPFGRAVLGAALDGPAYRLIAISDRLEASPLWLAVLAHELAHMLLHTGCETACRVRWGTQVQESEAWYGAARMAISDDEVWQVAHGRSSLRQLAGERLLPVPFIRLGCAIPRPELGIAPRVAPDVALHWWGRYMEAVACRLRAA